MKASKTKSETGNKQITSLVITVICLLILSSFLLIITLGNREQREIAESNLYQVALRLGTVENQRDEAQRHVQASNATNLALKAQKLYIEGNEEVSILLAVQSMRMLASGAAAQVLSDHISTAPISLTAGNGHISSYDFTADGQYAALLSDNGSVYVTDLSTGRRMMNKYGTDSYVDSVDLSPDGKYVIVTACFKVWDWEPCNEASAVIFDASTGERITFFKNANRFFSAKFSPDGKSVILGGFPFSVRDVLTGKETAHLSITDPYKDWHYPISDFSADGRYIASTEHVIDIWEPSTGKVIAQISPDSLVLSIALSPDGKYLATGESGALNVWKVSSGQKIFHEDLMVQSVSFSRNGHYLAFTSGDAIDIWDITSETEISRMLQANAVSVAFVQDDEYVISGNSFGDVRFWRWKPEDLITEACSHVKRNLNPFEWQQYVGDILPYQAVCPDFPLENIPVQPIVTIPTAVPATIIMPTLTIIVTNTSIPIETP